MRERAMLRALCSKMPRATDAREMDMRDAIRSMHYVYAATPDFHFLRAVSPRAAMLPVDMQLMPC